LIVPPETASRINALSAITYFPDIAAATQVETREPGINESQMTQRDWNEPRPRGTDLDTIDRIMKALREIEAGRAPQTRWEQETYSAAFAQGIVRRPLPTN
jgi:hypothetical protein